MKRWKTWAATLAVAAAGATVAVAQTNDTVAPQTPGSRPTTVIPAPSATEPAPATEGAGTGETGFAAPAGIPADSSTDQNQQPGMSNHGPSDPAAGSNPGARVPTSPPGTGTSSP